MKEVPTTPPQVEMLPVERIRVMNPRVRDKKRFAEIVRNIETIGLKRPITVRQDPESNKADPIFTAKWRRW